MLLRREFGSCLAQGVGATTWGDRERNRSDISRRRRNKGRAKAVEVMRLEVHSEAREEFLQAVSYYDAQVPGLGLRFITEIDRCHDALLETPWIGHPYGGR